MNSSEIARLAGVSVRTLRHYHQVGVLPEPERSANGYRRYAVADLVLLLRIKRLGSLGIPLDAMGPVLDDAGAPEAAAMLDELDSELQKQMAQLAAQRDLIARIRADRSDLDLAPELAAMRRASQAMGMSARMEQADRDLAVLLAHFVDVDQMSGLADFYARIGAVDTSSPLADLIRRFDALPDDADDATAEALASDIAEAVAAAFGPLDDAIPGVEITHPDAVRMFRAYHQEQMSEVQFRVLSLVEERFGS